MVGTEGKNILKFLYALDFFKNAISKCKLRLLEPLKKPHLKKKCFSKEKRLIQIIKYLVKTIGYKL